MKKFHTTIHRDRNIRKIGPAFHAYVDEEERSYPDSQSAKSAIGEMLDNRPGSSGVGVR
jgi:hypothetical protein